jgi:hypothetical protein
VHFVYDRAERAPIEQGPEGRVLLNLFNFQRSAMQRMILQGRKLRHGTKAEKLAALSALGQMIVAGLVADEIIKRLLGRDSASYSPLSYFKYEIGGLEIGATNDLTGVLADTIDALQGDRDAQAKLTVAVPRLARLQIPFLDWTLRMVETGTDQDYIDRKFFRWLRSQVDEKYEPKWEFYEADRSIVEAVQHLLFNAHKPRVKVETVPATGTRLMRPKRPTREKRTLRPKRAPSP